MASGPRRRRERPLRDPGERRATLHELVAALLERVEAEALAEESWLDEARNANGALRGQSSRS